MFNHPNLNPDYFLNWLALEKMADPHIIDPYQIIDSFFELSDPQETIDFFRDACHAALTKQYRLKGQSPGNLVFFYERLEMLVEACYLLNVKQVSHVQQSHTAAPVFSNEQLINPFLTIAHFFEVYDLPTWKQFMHCWMEAAISKYSVVENIDPEHILPYYEWMERLIVAGCRLFVKKKQ